MTETAATPEATGSPSPPPARFATEDYVDRRVAELEARLTWRSLGIAALIVAAVKFIPPAY